MMESMKASNNSIFLPSISSFYIKFLTGLNRPAGDIKCGGRQLDFLNPRSYFYHPWALYSAGHADLELKTNRDSMVQDRDRKNTFILGDSGGYQISSGVLKFDWQNFYETPSQPNYIGKADKMRMKILNWLEHTADYSMVLDLPAGSIDNPKSSLSNFSFSDCLTGTLFNNEFFIKNRQGKTKFLNVLQGRNQEECDIWYDQVKQQQFEGWAIAGASKLDLGLFLRRLIYLRDEHQLDEKNILHCLGNGRLDWAVVWTLCQRILRQQTNPNLTITFDCATPFVTSSKGTIYTQAQINKNDFKYAIAPALDSDEYVGSNLKWPWSSPILDKLTIGDICQHPRGTKSKSTYDSYSYALQQAHNTWVHINSVEQANRIVDVTPWHECDIDSWIGSRTRTKQEYIPTYIYYILPVVKEILTSECPMDTIERYRPIINYFGSNGQTTTSFSELFE